MLHMKQLNSKKTRFPRFDKILVIQPIAEMYGESNERQLCWEIADAYSSTSYSRWDSMAPITRGLPNGKGQVINTESKEEFSYIVYLNSLPNDRILDWSKVKAFADDNIKFAKMMIFFVFDRVENIVGKGENADYQHFLLFPQCFQKVFFFLSLSLSLSQGR